MNEFVLASSIIGAVLCVKACAKAMEEGRLGLVLAGIFLALMNTYNAIGLIKQVFK